MASMPCAAISARTRSTPSRTRSHGYAYAVMRAIASVQAEERGDGSPEPRRRVGVAESRGLHVRDGHELTAVHETRAPAPRDEGDGKREAVAQGSVEHDVR